MNIDYSKYYWRNSLITLRQPLESDWELVIHNRYDSESRFLFTDEIELPTETESFRKNFVEDITQSKDYLRFAITNNEDKHVGIVHVFGIDEKNGVFGPIGIQINPLDRGMGYATAVYRMLGKYMFSERRMHKWNSEFLEENVGSERLHKKIGFNIEGIRKDMSFHEGRYWNLVLAGITEHQFYENEMLLPIL